MISCDHTLIRENIERHRARFLAFLRQSPGLLEPDEDCDAVFRAVAELCHEHLVAFRESVGYFELTALGRVAAANKERTE